jgi:hypothetical protein
MRSSQVIYVPADFAGYFGSAAKIIKFLPEEWGVGAADSDKGAQTTSGTASRWVVGGFCYR